MDDTLEQVTSVCLDALKLSELPPDADLVAAGMDSLLAVQIAERLEVLYGVDVLPALVGAACSLEAHAEGKGLSNEATILDVSAAIAELTQSA